MTSEIRLVKKAIKGHVTALEELLSLHQEQMYRTAYLYMQNEEESLDVVQETAYLVTKNIQKLKEPQYFKSWMIRILINVAHQRLKKQKQIIFLNEPETIEHQVIQNDLGSMANRVASCIDLTDAIGTLKSVHRDAIVLYYYHDLSTKEIAKLLNQPEATVRTHLARGRAALKIKLEGDEYHA